MAKVEQYTRFNFGVSTKKDLTVKLSGLFKKDWIPFS